MTIDEIVPSGWIQNDAGSVEIAPDAWFQSCSIFSLSSQTAGNVQWALS